MLEVATAVQPEAVRTMWRQGKRQQEVPTSRVIRPGDEPEWVSVVHKDGSISEVKIDGDNGELGVRICKAHGVELHLSGGW